MSSTPLKTADLDPNHTTVVVGGQTFAAGRGYQPVMTNGPSRALDQCNELSRRLRKAPPAPTIEDRREVPATGPGTPDAAFRSLQATSELLHPLTGRPRGGSLGMGGK